MVVDARLLLADDTSYLQARQGTGGWIIASSLIRVGCFGMKIDHKRSMRNAFMNLMEHSAPAIALR